MLFAQGDPVIQFFKYLFAKKVTEQDFNNALANLGDARDREDFEWKLRNALFR